MSEGVVIYNTTGRIIFDDGGNLTIAPKPRKYRNHSAVKHEFILEMSKVAEDEYWRNYLVGLSKDAFSKDFKVSGKKIWYSYKKKKTRDSVDLSTDPKVSVMIFIDFMHRKGFFSPTDESAPREESTSRVTRKKTSKKPESSVISDFISGETEKHSMKQKEIDRLRSIIGVGLAIDVIKIKNEKLTGITWDGKRHVIPKSVIKTSKAKGRKNVDDDITEYHQADMIGLWCNFYKNIDV